MSYLVRDLKYRIQILQGIDVPNETTGGFDRSYRKLITLWAGKRPTSAYVYAIRSVNADKNENDTDEFFVRYTPVIGRMNRAFADDYGDGYTSNQSQGMGKEYDINFSIDFNSLSDEYPIKCDYFIFLFRNTTNYRGRLYKINRIIVDDENQELIKLRCTEIEEQGLGAND